MHIRPAGMAVPFVERVPWIGPLGRVVLKNAKVAHGVTGGTDRGKQLKLAVKKSLAPLRMAGAHAEYPLSEGQGPAMFSQGGSCQFRPVLPQGCH
jgi:hypothetical protein